MLTTFHSTTLQAGSVCVLANVSEDSSCPSALFVARNLEKQVGDANSKLRQGQLTSKAKEVDVLPTPADFSAELEALRKVKVTLQHEVESLKRSLATEWKGGSQEVSALRKKWASRELEVETLQKSLEVMKTSNATLEMEVELYKKEQEDNRQMLEQAKTNAGAFAALTKDAAEEVSKRPDAPKAHSAAAYCAALQRACNPSAELAAAVGKFVAGDAP